MNGGRQPQIRGGCDNTPRDKGNRLISLLTNQANLRLRLRYQQTKDVYFLFEQMKHACNEIELCYKRFADSLLSLRWRWSVGTGSTPLTNTSTSKPDQERGIHEYQQSTLGLESMGYAMESQHLRVRGLTRGPRRIKETGTTHFQTTTNEGTCFPRRSDHRSGSLGNLTEKATLPPIHFLFQFGDSSSSSSSTKPSHPPHLLPSIIETETVHRKR